MKERRRFIALVLLVVCGGLLQTFVQQAALRAQEDPPQFAPQIFLPVAFGVSPAIRDLPPDPTVKPGDVANPDDVKATEDDAEGELAPLTESAPTPDAAVQTEPSPEVVPSPSLSFDGVSNGDNFVLYGGRFVPPDTVGDVGPNHYVQMVNSVWRVFDKSGAPLTPPRKLNSVFASLPGPCATRNDGDGIVLYDPLADRWLFSQFCVVATPFDHQLIAISQTGDPTGAYFLYDFMVPNIKFNDYPKFGVWPDAYYMTDNQFNQAGTAFQGAGVYAFNRAKMLVGDPTANYIYFDTCPTSTGCTMRGMLPADLDGLTPPPAGSPGLIMMFNANEFGDAAGDALRLFAFHADFAAPASSTFTERPESPLPVAAFNPTNPSGRNDIEQPPPATSTASLDSISDRLMFRLAYRKRGITESLVTTHTVNVGGAGTTQATHQAGIRYYELRRTTPGGAFSINEQATFSPSTENRWMGSVAMDNSGDIAVGYSVSSTTTFPSVRYAGRLWDDPPGGLFQGETTLVAGTGVQRLNSGTGAGRWGDYSGMSVDPADECTFWYTQEYYTAASQATSTAGWVTRIGRFSFPSCEPATPATISGTATNSMTGFPIPGVTVQASGGYLRSTDGAGVYGMNVTEGSYDMSATKFGFLPGSASGVTATAGSTTVQNFSLVPVPVLAAAGAASITSEDCSPTSGTVEPGETVTVSLPVKNIGALDSTNLVGTLLATGGVTSPSSPQSYGVVLAGGAAVARSFTFTADSGLACGAKITATLSLQDGATSLGTLSYEFTTGGLGAPSTAVYSTGGIAVTIPDVSTVEVPITVSDSGVVNDVNVRVRLNHTFDGDLQLSLIAPDGTVVPLASNRGGAGQNYGTGANDCSGTHTVFDDSAAAAISGGVAPFAGSFRPEQPLSGLNGKEIGGTWKLRVADTAAIDTGTVGCVQLEIRRLQHLCCPFTGGVPSVVAVPPASLVSESCGSGNGAPDPDETVSVSFPLRDIGSGPTTNLVATLLSGGGVATPSGPQSYGVLSPVGGAVSRTFSFVPQGTCGGTLTATLHLQDGLNDLGNVSFNLTLGASVATPTTLSNTASISIPSVGAATPYPSSITMAGITDPVTKVTVRLSGFSHTFPDDVDVLLVGPAGQKILLMSDVGGSTPVTNLTLTFDDAAAATIPDAGPMVSGTFRPSNIGAGDSFPAPAPAGPYPDPQLLSVFNGVNPNGTWRLFVVDGFTPDSGTFAGGWSLTITTAAPVCCNQPCSLSCPADVLTSNDTGVCGKLVSFGGTGVTGTCGTLDTTPASGSFFGVGTTPVTTTATTSGGSITTCTFNVTVADAENPGISCPADIVVSNEPGLCSAVVTFSVGVTDNCPGATVGTDIPSGTAFPVGTTTVHATATDAAGLTSTCSFDVTVNDTENPVVTVGLSPELLWPPNHQMVPVTATVASTDNCGATACFLASATSNEPDNATGNGDGNTDNDIQNASVGTMDVIFDLRSERAGTGQGRVYTATYTCNDLHGNATSAGDTVFVPHDQHGVVDPVSLAVTLNGAEAVLSWSSVPGADYYSVIRGNRGNLVEEPSFINLGAVDCLESATQATSRNDADMPQVGEVYFYLVAYHDGMTSTYGSPHASKPRVTGSGGCQNP